MNGVLIVVVSIVVCGVAGYLLRKALEDVKRHNRTAEMNFEVQRAQRDELQRNQFTTFPHRFSSTDDLDSRGQVAAAVDGMIQQRFGDSPSPPPVEQRNDHCKQWLPLQFFLPNDWQAESETPTNCAPPVSSYDGPVEAYESSSPNVDISPAADMCPGLDSPSFDSSSPSIDCSTPDC